MADYRTSDWAGYKGIARQHDFDWKNAVNTELVRLADEADSRMAKWEIRGTYKDMAANPRFWAADPADPTNRPHGYKIIGGTEKQYRNWVVRARKWVVKNDTKDAKTNRSGAKRKRAAPKETDYCSMANGLADMLQDEKGKVQELETTVTEITQATIPGKEAKA